MAFASIQTTSTLLKTAMVVLALISILFFVFSAKWSLANAISRNAVYKEQSQLAIDWSPNDPQTHYSLAAIEEKTLIPDDFPRAVENYEKAAALSPNNYLIWLALGKARERNGDSSGAEKALQQAIELAPNYSENRWTLGNIFLRQGKNDEAFAEIRKSAETDDRYTNSLISAAWRVFDGDIQTISGKIGNSESTKSAFALFLAKQQKFDEAINIWSNLPETERKTKLKENGIELANVFIANKKFRLASLVQSQISETNVSKIAIAKFTNAGFEDNINPTNTTTFDWQIANASQPQIGIDNKQKHEGNQSLVMVFNSTDGNDFRQISQTVAVESGKKYQFQTFYKSELKANATVKWEVLDANDNKILATSQAIVANSDWHNLVVDFTTQSATEAVIVRLVKASCGSSICPISGKIWFDEFSFQ